MNNKNLVKLSILFLLMTLCVTSCSAFGPAAVAKKVLSATFNGNCENIPQHLTSDYLSGLGGETEMIAQCEDLYDNQIASEGLKVKSLKLTDTFVEGNEAMVYFTVIWNDGDETSATVMVKREDGHWKVWTLF